jgi:chorismate mutase/prephenate dehydratase
LSAEASSPADPQAQDDPRPGDLDRIRKDIDRVDREILELLAERRALSVDVAQEKHRRQQPFWDRSREEELIADRIRVGRSHALDASFITRVWREITDDSLRLQQELVQQGLNQNGNAIRVAFQGIEGSYSQLATRQFFEQKGAKVGYLGCALFKDVVEAVEEGRADVAMLPVENTTSGGITEVYDLLLHSQLALVGEINFRVRHCLLGVEGATLEGLKTVYCHPQAVLQCSNFLAGLSHCEIVYFSDTALSGRRIKELNDPAVGAIASEEAARILGLEVLEARVGNRDENYTRFVVAGRKPIKVDEQIPCKTSLVMSVGNEPGALLQALAVFRDEGINLVKLESRPILHNPWEEMFYLDFDGNVEEPRVQRALDLLTAKAQFIKVLGSYPSEDLRPHRPSIPPTPLEPRRRAPLSRVLTKPRTADEPKGYRLGSRDYKEEDTVISVRGVRIGDDELLIIAGPCAVESYDQIMQCAREVKEHGGHVLRGGCFKPRTSPYSFQGLGYEGLEMLAEAARAFDLPIVTEVLAPEDVQRMAEQADILQIGTRNMQNFSLLSEVGKVQRPVMLKRGMSSSIDELLQAAEYILTAGNQQVFLCERGIRTFETSTRNTLDLSAVPVLRRRTHLPVIVDPSHATGDRELVPPLALAAQAVGANGVMMEIHPDPEKALSDGPQALEFDQFEPLMAALTTRA